ncbi:hypothetical protein V5298_19665, partial [Alteromonas sp. 14N.309.X.WAT.G.H12]
MTIEIKRPKVIQSGLLLLLMALSFYGYSQTISNFNSEQFTGLQHDYAAHWLQDGVILLPEKGQYVLVKHEGDNDEKIKLQAMERPPAIVRQYPHLAKFYAYFVPLETDTIKSWLKHEVMVVALSADNKPLRLSYVQTGAVIDALYTSAEHDADEVNDLGAVAVNEHQVQFKLWAPTA